MADAASTPPATTPRASAVPEDPATDRLDPTRPRHHGRGGDGRPVEGGTPIDVETPDREPGRRDASIDDPVDGTGRRAP